MEKSIEGTKALIETQVNRNSILLFGQPFSEYQKVYFWTNENIDGYLSLVDLSNFNNALSVMASGDHAFNLIAKGIMNIDTYDTNKLTEYYVLGLKRAMILKYSYQEFLEITNKITTKTISILEITQIILDLLPYMDKKYIIFWQAIIDYNYKIQTENDTNLNLFDMLFIGTKPPSDKVKNNTYLLSEENYYLLKNSLGRANISFKFGDAKDLDQKFPKQYDIILLSNILDYFHTHWGIDWEYHELVKYENKLRKIMNDDGILFLKYIMIYGSKEYTKKFLFEVSSVTTNDLTDEEVYKIPRNTLGDSFSGMVLKRIK